MLSRALLAPLERALVAAIATSTAAGDELTHLEGRRLRVVVLGTPLRIDLAVTNARPRLEPAGGEECAATITGPPLSLLQVARGGTPEVARSNSVRLVGDLDLIERWRGILLLAQPTPEQLLADWIGDLPAHALSTTANRARRWAGHALRSLRLNAVEYLQEEGRQLPAPLEAEDLFEEIERLRDDVERASRRLDLLSASKP
jgi:ubiquinone biosynthesis protein UbiJ